MIVKNEEENIERALLSVKPVVDEMIVVDTGSTDRTKDIATALGARVYDFPWNDDFSEARNFSLSKASGDWILILDADEVISPLDHGKLGELVNRPAIANLSSFDKLMMTNAVAYSFTTRTYVSQMNTSGWSANDGRYPGEEAGNGWYPGEKVRLFPNDKRFRFEFPLHERIEPSLIKAGIEIRNCDMPIHHYGNLLNREKTDSKAEHYYQLGKRKLAKHGKRNYVALHELAVQASALGKHKEALEYLNKVIALKPDYAKAYQSMGNINYNLGNYREALSFYKKAAGIDPGSRDSALMYATCELLTGNAEAAIALAEDLTKNEASYPQAMLLLAEAYFCTGAGDKAIGFVRKMEDMHFDIGGALVKFTGMLVSAGRRQYAVSLLEGVVGNDIATDKAKALLEELRGKGSGANSP